MDILEMARQLGQLIKDSDEMKRMNIAEEHYNEDIELQAMVDEYNANDNAMASTDDASFIEVIKNRMTEIYNMITANPIYAEYMKAQEEIHRLMNTVNSEINFVVTGERGCSGDSCGGCSGCHS
jgi:cell fate (sporulation/competence/biofilm development) regulator YmcA (YheA/YmcA/DUF963 family)